MHQYLVYMTTQCRPELSEQHRHETNAMDASAGARLHVTGHRILYSNTVPLNG